MRAQSCHTQSSAVLEDAARSCEGQEQFDGLELVTCVYDPRKHI